MVWIRQGAFLAVAGVLVGLLVNAAAPGGLDVARFDPSPPPVAVDFPRVDLLEARQMFDLGRAVFVDARPGDVFAMGRVPGAFNVPEHDSRAGIADLQSIVPPDQLLVVYCDSHGCRASGHVAELLRANGFTDVRVFEGGWDQWEMAHLPVEWD